jgi:hypothetical protein
MLSAADRLGESAATLKGIVHITAA